MTEQISTPARFDTSESLTGAELLPSAENRQVSTMHSPDYPKSATFSTQVIRDKIMGPNPLLLCEELLESLRDDHGVLPNCLQPNRIICDLGSGCGITSALMAREYGLRVFACDLWSNPSDNMRFFESQGLSNAHICPLKADASEGLPFASEFFDAVVSIDSYNYFGRDEAYLAEHLLPYVKTGGLICLALPGMVKDCHDNLPEQLLLSWTPEQLEFMHDKDWWVSLISKTSGIEIVGAYDLACHKLAWAQWLTCDNEYARSDRAAIEAGADDILSTFALVIRKL